MNRTALRLAALSFLLPVPVAFAAPQTLAPQQLGSTSLPVTGVGDAVLPQVLPAAQVRRDRGPAEDGPVASMTRLERRQAEERASAVAANGIPKAAFRAYRTAEATMGIADPSCRLSWGLLAGIGRIESDHGRFGGAVVARNGQSTPQIVGLPLNGVGAVAAIADTDNGRLDGDRRWDRAVGPMQFIPSTWTIVGVDGDADGRRNPHDLDDAALAAAAYLCAGDRDLSTAQGVHDALFSYNHSQESVALVSAVAHAYESGAVDLPLLATLSMPTGPGLQVGVGAGRGVPIGATDDDSASARGRGDDRRADGRKAGEPAADSGRRGDRARDGSVRESEDRGSTPPARDPKNDPSREQDRGGDEDSDAGGDGGKDETDVVVPEQPDAEPKQPADEGSSDEGADSGSEGSGSGEGEPEVVEPDEPEEPEVVEPDEPEEPEVVEPEEFSGTLNTDCGSPLCLQTEGGPNYVLEGAPASYVVGDVVAVMARLENDGSLLFVAAAE